MERNSRTTTRICAAKAEPQVRELLTGYGPVALIWFDTPRMMTPERGQRFADIVRSMQPNTLIDGRLGTEGDYRSTGDNVDSAGSLDRSLGDARDHQRHMGLSKRRHELEVARPDRLQARRHRQQGRQLPAERRSDRRRVIPQASQDILRTVGRWLKVNGDAVYGAGASPFGQEFGEYTARGAKDVRGQRLFLQQTEWRVTTKPGKLYFTFFSEPRAPFEIPAIKNKITRAYRLADHAPVELATENGKTTITLERPMLDPMATVVVVEFEGPRVEAGSELKNDR